MKIIQPMLNAIRNNDFAAMYKYEDIMINLDELMQSHKQSTEYEGRVKEAMDPRRTGAAGHSVQSAQQRRKNSIDIEPHNAIRKSQKKTA